MLGEGTPPPLELGKKRSRSVKVMKRDSVKILKRDSRSIKSVRLSSTLLLPVFLLITELMLDDYILKSGLLCSFHILTSMLLYGARNCP